MPQQITTMGGVGQHSGDTTCIQWLEICPPQIWTLIFSFMSLHRRLHLTLSHYAALWSLTYRNLSQRIVLVNPADLSSKQQAHLDKDNDSDKHKNKDSDNNKDNDNN